jgi:hypothetical protein
MHLIFENGLRHSTKHWAGIIEAFEHSKMAIGAEGCDETHFFFIFFMLPNLEVAGETV